MILTAPLGAVLSISICPFYIDVTSYHLMSKAALLCFLSLSGDCNTFVYHARWSGLVDQFLGRLRNGTSEQQGFRVYPAAFAAISERELVLEVRSLTAPP